MVERIGKIITRKPLTINERLAIFFYILDNSKKRSNKLQVISQLKKILMNDKTSKKIKKIIEDRIKIEEEYLNG